MIDTWHDFGHYLNFIKFINASPMKSSVKTNANLKINFSHNEMNDLITIHRMAGNRAYPHFIKKTMK
jgi:hypothetical protein